MQENHKIVIFDGADRVGKSSSINKLIEEYEKNEYLVVTMFHPTMGVNTRDIDFDDEQKFEKHYKANEDMYSIQSGSLDLMSYWMKKIFDINLGKKVVILVDRLHISALVFGMSLRRSSFKKIFKTTDQFVQFMNTFERRIQVFAQVTMLIFINDSEIVEEDNDHEIVKMSVDKLKTSNSMFEIASGLSVIEQKHVINCQSDEKGWFNTYPQIIEILSKTM